MDSPRFISLFSAVPLFSFSLPLSTSQHNDLREGMDINVTGVWEYNITGSGVTVVVVDDGVEHTLQDIQPNYVSHVKFHFLDSATPSSDCSGLVV